MEEETVNIDVQINDRLPIALLVAYLAGQRLAKLFGLSPDELRVQIKDADGHTPRTIIDTEIGGIIRRGLRKAFPQDAQTDEELGSSGESTNGWRWWIDPFDGTSNAVPAFRTSTIGIAAEYQGVMQLGIIVDPFDPYPLAHTGGTVTYARLGGGAHVSTLNGDKNTPIKVVRGRVWSERFMTVDALFNTHTGFRKATLLKYLSDPQNPAATMNVRMTGSNLLSWAHVAQGRIEAGLMDAVGGYWDAAPGVVIVPEAGGKIVNIHGNLPKPGDQVMLATNGEDEYHRPLYDLVTWSHARYAGFRH